MTESCFRQLSEVMFHLDSVEIKRPSPDTNAHVLLCVREPDVDGVLVVKRQGVSRSIYPWWVCMRGKTGERPASVRVWACEVGMTGDHHLGKWLILTQFEKS